MFAVVPDPIPARMRGLNRAEICDANFLEFIRNWQGRAGRPPTASEPILPGSALEAAAFGELFESQLASRHLDLMARVLRVQDKVYYTIGSAGHEGNAMLARACRVTDPAFLHYRSGAFMAERARQVPGIDPVLDTALSFAASVDDPASGGRHKVWGSRALWVLPQTSTIASHLPKALGTALAIESSQRLGQLLPVPVDSIVICSFGDASANHATAQTAFNTASWSAHQKLPAPVLFVCEDNGLGISVRTPEGWIAQRFGNQPGLDYFAADGLDLAAGHAQVTAAVDHCRRTRRPTFLHLRTTRLMGHAGTDFEVEWRALDELCRAEACDPLLRSAQIALQSGWMDASRLERAYEAMRSRCFAAAELAQQRPRLRSLAEVVQPLAPYSPQAVQVEACRAPASDTRALLCGGDSQLPERLPPRHMALQINAALQELMCKYPQSLLFGEDVAQKGGVYTVTRGLMRQFGPRRVFNTLLDETMILGLAQGMANMQLLPIAEIQYLAYLHNALDQLRGEACSLQFFSNDQFRNPMLVRVPGLGYQKGFGGHFHNDNSITALRDIPGLVVGCPSRGDDAVAMLRTLAALARVDGRVCVLLEPIALYMTKDLHSAGDGQWLFDYPAPGHALVPGQGRVYFPEACDLVVFTFGNGVPMALRVARRLQEEHGLQVRVVDLRWLVPLDVAFIVSQAADARRVLVVDEGRRSGGVGEGVLSALVEAGFGQLPTARVSGADTYTPLAGAAIFGLPSDNVVMSAALALARES
ncbi:transketolase C-terminal domain-containing protein [Stenotrophomonas sp. C3(2023)]|uniref:transketolase C-terminal domain-containing protein n=1 Tax=Stenotrophomonas sp. C3(2023) TaxID=3080277 RepID=UPI00293C29B7|nr:transketolase C-terminal domain-containing protein [Stenotrophomonas sp. C3(2023)]MDV3468339.1 transketolase C-terminal domain-containing protein [Stenotrophomonas sp. C3(2023)]